MQIREQGFESAHRQSERDPAAMSKTSSDYTSNAVRRVAALWLLQLGEQVV